MMRSQFDAQLGRLNESLTEMGSAVERAIENACRALVTRDAVLARQTMAGDEAINRMEREIESLCLRLLLRQQPVASDLRLISAAMSMITDLERIGDHAQDVSEIVTYLDDAPAQSEPQGIARMSRVTTRMVRESVDAFVKRDLALARAVQQADDEVDALFLGVKRALAASIAKEPGSAQQALDMLMIAKYFERIGDHAVNVGEWVEFAMTGVRKGEKLQ